MKNKPPIEDRPQQSLMQTIRSRIKAGFAEDELARINALRREFPHFKPLLPLAWEAAHHSGQEILACQAAWDWSHSSPSSATAWEALAESAWTQFPALALFAKNKSDALNGHPPEMEPGPNESPFGALTFQQSVSMDTCRLLLSCGRIDEAQSAIAELDHVSARNNLALLVFARGEPERALELLEANWRKAPDNLFGLERMIRLRLWTRGMNYAAGLGAPLAATKPLRGDDLRAKLSGLILLDRFKDADAAWRNAEPEHIQSSREIEDDCHYMAAYAAWRLGKVGEALVRLRVATKGEACKAMAKQLLSNRESGDTPDWELSDFAAWWPLTAINAVKEEMATDTDEERVLKIVERFSPHNDYLERMVEQGGTLPRLIAMILLKSRAESGNAATAVLKRLLSRPCGPDEVRRSLQTWLVKAGLMETGTTVSMWFHGEVRLVRNYAFRIVDTPTDINLPLEDVKRFLRAIEYHNQGSHAKAESEMSALLTIHPRHPRILANLAIMQMNMNRSPDDVEMLAKRAFEADPDYPFSRIALAYVLIRKREPMNAMKILEPIMDREEIQIMEWRACLAAQKMAAEAMGEADTVKHLTRMIAEFESLYKKD